MNRLRRDPPRTSDPRPAFDWSGEHGARVLGALLFLVVAGVFLPALGHGFISYDDPVYVTQNPHVTSGLTWANVRWACQSTEASNWHPLTWVSHMLDCQLYGLQPWGHHFTSVLLHALNAVLLFAALRRLTGAVWRSLVVAALFGLHPLHVESVAWIAERKDVLSTAFGLLALWAYARRFAPRGAPGRGPFRELALLAFALSLTAKAMWVTLPCLLLVLDWWPLRRWEQASPAARWAVVLEKIPFFVLAAAASAVTVFAQSHGGTVASTGDFPWPVRIANAVDAYGWYLGRCFVPARLAVFYPNFAEMPPLGPTLVVGLLLAAITVAAVALRRRWSYLLAGWLWFGGTLVPVIGLVQIGGQAMADRYSYAPLVGVFLMVIWAAGDAVAAGRLRRPTAVVAAGAVLAALAVLTSLQLAYWTDGVSLFRHALAVTEDNYVAHANLAIALKSSAPAQAAAEMAETERIIAGFASRYLEKGVALEQTPGRAAEAIEAFRTAVRIMPVLAEPHYNLGTALVQIPGRQAEGIAELRTAVRLRPGFAAAHFNLGTALAGLPGGHAEAIAEFQTVVRLEPDNFGAHFSLGVLLGEIPGRADQAVAEYETVLRLKPDDYPTHFNLGVLLAGLPGRSAEAIAHLEAALKLKPDLEQARELIQQLRGAAR